MLLAATTDWSLVFAAIPTSIAAVIGARYVYLGTKAAAPKLVEAAVVEPRISDLEDRSAGWLAALKAKDELIATLRAELEECRKSHDPG